MKTGKKYAGRYEIRGRVAAGGMAEVFEAQDTLLARKVAVKVLHPEFARDRPFIERFRREAQSAASLNDPRIVSVYDWGSDEGSFFMVMEFVDGRTLREIITEEGPLSPERAVEIASDVCSALHIAHQKGIVHRDIKPANIAITSGGQTKVMDFGIARAGGDSAQTVTQTGTVIGTAAYLSPEQAQGMAVDARSDVYAVGVVLYEMLTREVPFKGDTPVAVAYKHVKEDPAPPSRLNAEIPDALDAIILKALAKNPDNRYSSALDMRSDLMRLLRGEKVMATPVLPPDQTVAMGPSQKTAVMPIPEDFEASTGKKALAYTLVFALAISVIVLLGVLLYQLLKGPPTGVVPDVVGEDRATAERLLKAAGFDVSVDEAPNETIEAGRVVSQDPTDQEKAPTGSEVSIVVSTGSTRTEVPDLSGKTRAEAEEILEKQGLDLGDVTSESNREIEPGRIFAQSPRAGSRVDRGSKVDVTVSSGRQIVKVPDVTGMDLETATENLTERGLVVKTRETCNTGRRDKQVLEQNPSAGTDVAEGTTVTLTVNRVLTVPSVMGETRANATNKLQEAGFGVRSLTVDEPGNRDEVIRQDPTGGERGCSGDVVTITVAM